MQKKFLLPLLALLFMAGGECFASKVIYKAGVSGKTVAFNFPASCVGHQASIWAVGFKRGENITVTLTFKNPAARHLQLQHRITTTNTAITLKRNRRY